MTDLTTHQIRGKLNHMKGDGSRMGIQLLGCMQELENAKRTSQYWKGEQLAASSKAKNLEAQLAAMVDGLELQNNALNGTPEALKVTCQVVALAAKKYDPLKAENQALREQVMDLDCEDAVIQLKQALEKES